MSWSPTDSPWPPDLAARMRVLLRREDALLRELEQIRREMSTLTDRARLAADAPLSDLLDH